MHNYLTTLGAKAILPVTCGDDATNLEDIFHIWKKEVTIKLLNVITVQHNISGLDSAAFANSSDAGGKKARSEDALSVFGYEMASTLSRRERRELKKAAQQQIGDPRRPAPSDTPLPTASSTAATLDEGNADHAKDSQCCNSHGAAGVESTCGCASGATAGHNHSSGTTRYSPLNNFMN